MVRFFLRIAVVGIAMLIWGTWELCVFLITDWRNLPSHTRNFIVKSPAAIRTFLVAVYEEVSDFWSTTGIVQLKKLYV